MGMDLPKFEGGRSRGGSACGALTPQCLTPLANSRQASSRAMQRSRTTTPALPSQAAAQGREMTLALHTKAQEWALALSPTGSSITLFEAFDGFLREFGTSRHMSSTQRPFIDEETFLRGVRRMKAPVTQAQALEVFHANDLDRDGRLSLREFGRALLPGLDCTTPKWLPRKEMPLVAPYTQWEHDRLHITAKPGQRDPGPDPDAPPAVQPPPRGLATTPQPKAKWGIPWIKRPFVPKRLPPKEPIYATTMKLYHGGPMGRPEGRPASVEGPPAMMKFPPGNTVDGEQKHFWHEWHWRNERAGRLMTKMDKSPGGALKVGTAELFAWPPDIKPI